MNLTGKLWTNYKPWILSSHPWLMGGHHHELWSTPQQSWLEWQHKVCAYGQQDLSHLNQWFLQTYRVQIPYKKLQSRIQYVCFKLQSNQDDKENVSTKGSMSSECNIKWGWEEWCFLLPTSLFHVSFEMFHNICPVSRWSTWKKMFFLSYPQLFD